MDTNQPLFIPVILGTSRQGRMSEQVAKFVVEEVAKRDTVETKLIDIRQIYSGSQLHGVHIEAHCWVPKHLYFHEL